MKNIEYVDGLENVTQAFLDYSAYNLQRRAIPDVRDGLKWSARQLLHAQSIAKLTYDKPFKKALKSVGQATSFSYCHGDSSCYGTYIRMAKPFAYRYPLQEANGNYGTLIDPQDHSASRYVELRGSELAAALLKDLDKDTVDEWEDTYDMEGQFPRVLPSVGFYNIVNGCISIGSGMSCSIPPFNLTEINNALIKLLEDENASDEEIICLPDFPTGATLLNKKEVIQSLIKGQGKACCVRATVDYDAKSNCLIVTEMPYSVYTNTIIGEINGLIEEEKLPYVKKVEDYTGQTPEVHIFLNKGVNYTKALKELYKTTSLQSYYSINMIMLKDGLYPTVFGLREALLEHLKHEKKVYIKAYQFDLNKINKRLHILNGMLAALSNIDKVIETIRNSSSTKEARIQLMTLLSIDEEQADAILAIKLAKLAKLEVNEIKKEKIELDNKAEKITAILNDENLLKEEIKKGLIYIRDKFGDERRTRCIDLDFTSEADDAEPIEKKQLLIHYTNLGNIYTQESTTLLTSRRGGKGSKIKLKDNEAVVQTLSSDNLGAVLAFTNKGQMYSCQTSELPINTKVAAAQLFGFDSGEQLTEITTISRRDQIKYFVFITKQGMIKKTAANEYDKRRGKALKAINLRDSDEVVSVHFVNTEPIGILTSQGNYVIINTDDINPIGRSSMGIRAIKLGNNDCVIDSKIINGKYLLTASANGIIKKSSLDEFPICNRGIKGKKISGVQENDRIIKFLTFNENCDIIITQDKGQIKFNTSELRLLSREAIGVKAIQLNENRKVVDLIKS